MEIKSIENVVPVLDPKKQTVLITGVTGQDGSFMVDYLLEYGDYNLIGGARRLSVKNHSNMAHLENKERFHLVNFDLTDGHAISNIVALAKPAYFINFAAQSFVKGSWDLPEQTWTTNTTGVLHCLEAIRLHHPTCRFYNAGSSEEFGKVEYSPQDELHPLRPQSPYAASKVGARQLVRVYRESYGLYAIQGWLFNHEGTRRGEEFVTRKITQNVVRIRKDIDYYNGATPVDIEPLELGNLSAKRDWSDAEDFIDAIWLMMNQEIFNHRFTYDGRNTVVKNLREYVVASGESHTIREFVQEAFAQVGIGGNWEGSGENEVFRSTGYWEVGKPQPVTIYPYNAVLVRVNPAFFRPAEVETLCGNPAKIKSDLGWMPKTTFRQLVNKMVDRDMLS